LHRSITFHFVESEACKLCNRRYYHNETLDDANINDFLLLFLGYGDGYFDYEDTWFGGNDDASPFGGIPVTPCNCQENLFKITGRRNIELTNQGAASQYIKITMIDNDELVEEHDCCSQCCLLLMTLYNPNIHNLIRTPLFVRLPL